MSDHDYVRILDEKERKSAAHSAKRRKCGAKSRKCSLPSDSLTPAQRKALNGDPVLFAMNMPCTFVQITTVSKDLGEEYLYRLIDRYNAPVTCIIEMLGTSRYHFEKWVTAAGIRIPERKSRQMCSEDAIAWNSWLMRASWETGFYKIQQYDPSAAIEEPKEAGTTLAPATPAPTGITSFEANITEDDLTSILDIMKSMIITNGTLHIKVDVGK